MSLLVILSFCFTGIGSLQLNMNNVTTMLSNNNTLLMCSYILEQDEILTIGILAYNKSENTFEHIAGYRPNQTAEILTYGAYLKGRVTLNNLTRTSTQAYILFHEISCIDETMYKCGITYLNKGLKLVQVESSEVNITITVPPEKPNTLYMTDTFALFKETDNATFICEGNVGNPKGKLIWQKQRKGENVSEVNTDIQTDYIKIEKYCSYVGMSSLTITLSDKDNQAVISCAEESLMNNTTMFRYTQPVNVLFKARTPRIMKFPNISTYSEGTDIIILTCISRGNPQPTYVWYFNEALTHVGSVLNIKNGRRSQSGLYICNASNSYSGTTFVASYSIDILIIKKTENSGISSNDSKIKVTSIIGVVCGVLAVIVIPFGVWILYNYKCCLTSNPETHVYDTIYEPPYEELGQKSNPDYNETSKSEKRKSGNSQSTEDEQPQQKTGRPSEHLKSSSNPNINTGNPSEDVKSSTNSNINTDNPSEDLKFSSNSNEDTGNPSEDLKSSTNPNINTGYPPEDLKSSTNSNINTDNPSEDLKSSTNSNINTDNPSEDLNSSTNSNINTSNPSANLSSGNNSNPETHVYDTIPEYEMLGQRSNNDYDETSKVEKRKSGNSQSTEDEQPQQNTGNPSEDLKTSTNSNINTGRPTEDLNSSSNSNINTGRPSEVLNSSSNANINTGNPSEDLKSSSNSYINLYI